MQITVVLAPRFLGRHKFSLVAIGLLLNMCFADRLKRAMSSPMLLNAFGIHELSYLNSNIRDGGASFRQIRHFPGGLILARDQLFTGTSYNHRCHGVEQAHQIPCRRNGGLVDNRSHTDVSHADGCQFAVLPVVGMLRITTLPRNLSVGSVSPISASRTM